MVFSGREEDPDAWVPIRNWVKIEDYSVEVSSYLFTKFEQRMHKTFLANINSYGDLMVPFIVTAAI